MENPLKLNLLNVAGTIYFFSVTLLCFFTSLFITLPYSFPDDFAAYLVFLFVSAEIIANYVAVIKSSKRNACSQSDAWARNSLYNEDDRSKGMNRPVTHQLGQLANQRYCLSCRSRQPARAAHCRLCHSCILKRDHHCIFTACCIGLHNQRHYLPFLMYIILGCSCCLYLQYVYLSDFLASPLSSRIWMFFYPVTLFLFFSGQASFGILVLVTIFFATLFAILASLYDFILQLVVIIRGQTTYEYFRLSDFKVHISPSIIYRNFYNVFGSYGIAQFVFPLPSLSMHTTFASRMTKTV